MCRRRAKEHMHLHVRSRAHVYERPVPAHTHMDPLQICSAPVKLPVGGLATCVVLGGREPSGVDLQGPIGPKTFGIGT